jgi:hypothetical protein
MKKKKIVLESKRSNDDYIEEIVRINKSNNNEYFFEIGTEVTEDIAEAVSILMRKVDWNDNIWNREIKEVDMNSITPEKSLFWLTGGYAEWRTLDNYNKPWCDCYLDFQEEFGILIINIIKKSKSFKEIRDNFNKYLNLPILYNFAVSKDMIRK